MLIYLFDGSWDGFLSGVHQAYYTKDTPEDFQIYNNSQQHLLATYEHIETNESHAKKVEIAIVKKLSSAAHSDVYRCFLSDIPSSYYSIYRYLRLGFKVGRDIINMHGHPIVLAIEKLSQKVSYESHRMLGFVRFQHQNKNFYYAEIAPDHCILPLILSHFKARMSDQDWVIHDSKRHIAAIYSCTQRECVLTPFTEEHLAHCTASDSEKLFSSLWTNYHQKLAISERKNDRLQRQFVPMRYRQHLTEFKPTNLM